MRWKSKWPRPDKNGKVKHVSVSMKAPLYPMRLQWGYTMWFGKPKIIPACPIAVSTGAYDRSIKKAVRSKKIYRMQYDEIATLRDYVAKYISRYDSRKCMLDGYVERLARWGAREIQARHHSTIVNYPYNIAEKGIVSSRSVRIDGLVDEVNNDGHNAVGARNELEEIRIAFGESVSPYDTMLRRQVMHLISEAIESLDDQERDIVASRVWKLMGYSAEHPDDQDELLAVIGERYGLQKERIRQIQEKALNKLRKRLLPVWREHLAA